MVHTLSEEAKWQPDQAAPDLGEIYREHVEYVWRVLSHLGVASSDVADVAQDVFITVKRRLPSFEGRSSLRTWIYGICLRTVSDYRGRAFRRREIPHEELPETPQAPAQHSAVESSQLRDQLRELLDDLRPEQRDVFVLYEIEELSMKEIAQILECPLQTAYSRLHAAREQLMTKLASGGHTP